jgi:hypothetical protein
MSLRPVTRSPLGDGYRVLTVRSLTIPVPFRLGAPRSDVVIGLVARTLDQIEEGPLPADADGSDLVYDFWPRVRRKRGARRDHGVVQDAGAWGVSGTERRSLRATALALATMTLLSVAVLLTWDAFPAWCPLGAHDIHQFASRTSPAAAARAALLALAFLFWAANQLWPKLAQAPLCNDIAIALFVADIFMVIASEPRRLNGPNGLPGPAADTRRLAP